MHGPELESMAAWRFLTPRGILSAVPWPARVLCATLPAELAFFLVYMGSKAVHSRSFVFSYTFTPGHYGSRYGVRIPTEYQGWEAMLLGLSLCTLGITLAIWTIALLWPTALGGLTRQRRLLRASLAMTFVAVVGIAPPWTVLSSWASMAFYAIPLVALCVWGGLSRHKPPYFLIPAFASLAMLWMFTVISFVKLGLPGPVNALLLGGFAWAAIGIHLPLIKGVTIAASQEVHARDAA